MGIKAFFKRAFSDMKEDAKAQHAVDKAEFAAAKAEAKADFAEAKASGNPTRHKQAVREEQERRIAEANAREADAVRRAQEAGKNE